MRATALVASAMLGILLTAASVRADDLARTAPGAGASPPHNWTGAYVGGHLGFAWGDSDWTANRPAGTTTSGSLDFARPYDAFKGTGSYFSGFQAGYNHWLPWGLVVGGEADVTAPNTIRNTQTITSPAIGQASFGEKVEMSGTVRGRLGYVHSNWLIYGTAGYAWTYDQFLRTQLLGTPVGA